MQHKKKHSVVMVTNDKVLLSKVGLKSITPDEYMERHPIFRIKDEKPSTRAF